MRQFLEQATGLSIYPMVSLFIFGFIFAIVLFRAFTIERSLVREMEELPFQDNNNNNNSSSAQIF